MNLTSKLLLISLFCLFILKVNLLGQFTLTGQDPSRIKWRQINTEKFRLIYDEQFESRAQEVAAILDYSLDLAGKSINQPTRKLNIVLHNYNSISNGFVSLAPARSEFYVIPPQDTYGQNWFEQLALHEGRHWAQMNRLKRKNTLLLSYLFGDLGWAIGVAQAHQWFLEGDAVVTETALSESGRGRLPSFEMGYRTILLTNHKPYHFRKAVFGSYGDYVPNHYELGYLMVAYNRVKYGAKLWENMLDEIGHNPFIAPSLFSIRKQTGLNREKLYEKTFRELDSIWTAKSKNISYTTYAELNRPYTTVYTSYRSACLYQNQIIAIKSGLSDVSKVVMLNPNTGVETTLFIPGIIPSNRIMLHNNLIIYDEYMPHIRWEHENYSLIKIFDISKNQTITLTHKSRYFSPCFSPDGKLIAVVETDIKGQHSLKILNSIDGQVLQSFQSPDNAAIQYPSYDSTGQFIVATLVDTTGKSLAVLNTHTATWEKLITSKKYDFTKPRYVSKYIIFNGTYSGIDNIYALDTTNFAIHQITSARFGAFDPAINYENKSIIYSNYTVNGYKLVKAHWDTSRWIPLDKVSDISLNLAEKLKEQEPESFNRNNIIFKNYASKPYWKFSHLLKIHSWLPFFPYKPLNSLSSERYFLGYQVFSQNILNTFSITAGQGFYKGSFYNRLQFSWLGWFPVISFGLEQGDTIRMLNVNQNLITSSKQLLLYSSLKLPFNLSQGSSICSFQPEFQYQYENKIFTNIYSNLRKGTDNIVTYLPFYIYQRMSVRDIVPRKGFSTYIIYSKPITSTSTFSTQTALNVNGYLPGFFVNHSIKLSYFYENQHLKYYFANTRLNPPRGYYLEWDSLKTYLKKLQIYSFDYFFPLDHSNFTVLKVIYFKRLYASIFTEAASGNFYDKINRKFYDKSFLSVGYQFFAEINMFFIPTSFTIGYRYAYRHNKKNTTIEPIISINYNF